MPALLATLVAVGALAVAYVAGGAVHDLVAIRRKRRAQAGTAALGALLTSTEGAEAARALGLLSSLPRSVLVSLLRSLAADVEGPALGRVRAVANATGLHHAIRRLARSRRWRRRLRAAQLAHLLPRRDLARRTLLEDRHALVRARTAEGLNLGESPEDVDILVRLLRDDHPAVAFAAQHALLQGGTVPLSALVVALDDPAFEGTALALEVLAKIPDPRLGGVLTRFADSPLPDVRAMTAQGLGAGAVPEAAETLSRLLGDPEPRVRASAAAAVGGVGAVELAPVLGRMLADRAWEVRHEAATALGELGPPGLLVLRRHVDDADRFASDIARQVLDIVAARSAGAVPSGTAGRPSPRSRAAA